MANHGERKSNKLLWILVSLIIVVVAVIGIYFLFDNGEETSRSIRNETITAENYEEVMNNLETEMKYDEEIYYLSYSIMCYMFEDGFASAFTNPEDETAMYTRIYGKTVQQLIDEGKQLMKDNDMTIEKFKKSLEETNEEIENLNDDIEEINNINVE